MRKGPDLTYPVSDTRPIILHLTKVSDGSDLDVSAYTSLTITINPDAAPDTPGSGDIDAMVGTFVTDGSDGRVAFVPSGANETAKRVTSLAYAPGAAFYDLSGINPAGQRDTLLDPGSKFEILQQIGTI